MDTKAWSPMDYSMKKCSSEEDQASGTLSTSTAADLKQEGSKRANSSKRKRKRTRPPFSPSTSSAYCSQNGGGSTPLPLNSLDLWNSAGFEESCKPVGYFAKQALPESASHWSETNEQRFMRGVFPELVKKNSVWARSRTSFTQDSLSSFQSPLTVPAEARSVGLGAYHEGTTVQKKSLWSVPNVLGSQGPESNKGVGLTKNSKIKVASALECGTGLHLESSDVAKHFEAPQGEAVLQAMGDESPVCRETLENLGVENEPCELRRKNPRTSKASLVSDSHLDTVKPPQKFWHVPGRSLNKPTRHYKSPVALSKTAKEKALPEAPSTSTEFLERPGEENITWIESLWRQRKSALITASALRSRKAPSPSHKVSKPRVLGTKNEEPLEPPKGGLQHEAKDVIVQTYDLQQEVKDAMVQTSFMCMIGKSINLDKTEKKHLREAVHTKEEEVQFVDMSLKQACGNDAITFGHYFSTDTTTLGVMRLDLCCEKAMSANNEHDMFLYAVDTGVNITTLGGTWMLLPKGSGFYVSRGLPFTLKNLGDTMVKILYVLAEPSKDDQVT